MAAGLWAGALFVLLCAAAALGFYVRTRIPERHRSQDTMELVGVTISLLVTFTSIVLGLLTGEVTTRFDQAATNDGAFSSQIVQVDQCFRAIGPAADPLRKQLQSYLFAVIVSTWPGEASPPGNLPHPDMTNQPVAGESLPLSSLLNHIRAQLWRQTPADAVGQKTLDNCENQYASFLQSRWNIIEESNSSISVPFYGVLVIWLVILFASFGLTARPNPLATIVVVLTSISITIAVGVIADLDQPYGGVFSISSSGSRNALADMLRD